MTAHEQWDIVTSVGITALAVASGRSIDTHRPDGLADDPFAADFVRAAQTSVPIPTQLPDGTHDDPDFEELWAHMANHLGVRTRFFDRFFQQATEAGTTQAVVLASGLDTRAFRLDWPEDFRFFEIDQPKVLEFKDSVLAERDAKPRCERHAVARDLREDWATALEQAGFDREQPTAWLAEGLLPYLPPEAEEQLLTTIHDLSAPGSHIAIEHPNKILSAMDESSFARFSGFFGVDMHDLLHEDDRTDADIRLASQGWTVTVDPVSDIADRYERPLESFARELAKNSRFITAKLSR